MNLRQRRLGLPVAVAATLLIAGCTSAGPATSGVPASAISAGASHAPTTITVWTFNHLPEEVAAFKALFTRVHERYPWLTVDFVPNKDDSAFAKAVAAGQPPDVLISATPDNVAKFCHNGTVADLTPYLASAGLDVAKTFPASTLVYTKYQGKTCALPLLVDVQALFYDKKAFAAAGISQPPRTLTELTEAAKKLTVKNPDGTVKRFGFVPRTDYNTNSFLYYGVQAGAKFYGSDGKSTFGSDPRWAKLISWDKQLIDFYGAKNVQDFVGRYQAHADDAGNALLSGAVAMEVDGEWHVGENESAKTGLDYGVAPLPMVDEVADHYGAGSTLGTVAYVPAGSKHQQEAFFAVQQLTTDTEFLTRLANTVYNIPTTFASLAAWDKRSDPHWKPLIDIFTNSGSYYKELTPAGQEDVTLWDDFVKDYEAGTVSDLPGGLRTLATKVDQANTQAVG